MLATIQRCLKPQWAVIRYIHSQYISVEESNGTREITLCHEKTKNSLSLDMMADLTEAINANKDDSSLRAIVLAAKGNVFSAGHNLKELKPMREPNILSTPFIVTSEGCCQKQASTGREHHQLVFNKCTELMKSIVLSPVPVIAKVNGFATAAGCQLVATCDMIVCSDVSKFSTPGANFGIFCSTPGIAVGRSVPKSRATYMLFTGEPLTAQQAYESGLVTTVVPTDKLDEEVNRIIDKIKLKSRSVVALGKQFFYKQLDLGLFDAYKLGAEVMVQNINADDGQEGIRSFVEKRKPKWSHKIIE